MFGAGSSWHGKMENNLEPRLKTKAGYFLGIDKKKQEIINSARGGVLKTKLSWQICCFCLTP